jgi:ABC-2 type transport system ATP-binding protein
VSTGVPALLVQGVTKEFHRQGTRRWPWRQSQNEHSRTIVAVDDVSMTIQPREIFGVLGANGSGKSTLIRLVSTLLLPDRGTVTVFGHDVVKEELAVKRLISRVSVDAAFFKKLSPMENLIYSARLYDLNASAARERAIEIMGRLGIERKRVYESMEEMSRGMQQKVAIARGFLTSPVLMLLDEPTTGLDPRSKREVQRFVLDLRQGHEATILLTTHDMDEADRLCDRIAILEGGKVIALDTPEGLKRLAREHEGHRPTLEDAFMILTGHALEEGEVVDVATQKAGAAS